MSFIPEMQRDDEEGNGRKQIINRKDSKRPAGIEIAVVIRLVLRVIQNASDQKTRKYKKQINATPPEAAYGCCPPDCSRGAINSPVAIVMKNYEENRQSAQSIQRRNVLARRGGLSYTRPVRHENCCHLDS
jgi:hypothetical protein